MNIESPSSPLLPSVPPSSPNVPGTNTPGIFISSPNTVNISSPNTVNTVNTMYLQSFILGHEDLINSLIQTNRLVL
jgi:hypothetical protein